MLQYPNFEKFAIKLAKDAGKILLKRWRHIQRGQIHYKDHREIVTKADLESNKYITGQIKKHFPNHDIITEEQKIHLNHKEYIWIIDPLDGTNNFVMGSPLFAVNIGLAYNPTFSSPYLKGRLGGVTNSAEVILGIIYLPATGDLYVTRKNGGAYLNGKRIYVSKKKNIGDLPIVFCHGYRRRDVNMGTTIYSRVHPKAFYCRVWGAAGVEFGAVAHGGVGAFIVNGAKAWDVAPGILAVREAGGKVTDIDGRDWYLGMNPRKNVLIASNSLIHNDLLKIIKRG